MSVDACPWPSPRTRFVVTRHALAMAGNSNGSKLSSLGPFLATAQLLPPPPTLRVRTPSSDASLPSAAARDGVAPPAPLAVLACWVDAGLGQRCSQRRHRDLVLRRPTASGKDRVPAARRGALRRRPRRTHHRMEDELQVRLRPCRQRPGLEPPPLDQMSAARAPAVLGNKGVAGPEEEGFSRW